VIVPVKITYLLFGLALMTTAANAQMSCGTVERACECSAVFSVFKFAEQSDAQELAPKLRSRAEFLIGLQPDRQWHGAGTWKLMRPSSNKPELVVAAESPVSEQPMHDMFHAVDAVLRENREVGEYNQTI
jgi:phosphomannomutase